MYVKCAAGPTVFVTESEEREPMKLTFRGSLNVKRHRAAHIAVLCVRAGMQYITPRAPFQRDLLLTMPPDYISDILALGTANGEEMMRLLRDVLRGRRPKILARWPSLSVAVREVLGKRRIVWGCGKEITKKVDSRVPHLCEEHTMV